MTAQGGLGATRTESGHKYPGETRARSPMGVPDFWLARYKNIGFYIGFSPFSGAGLGAGLVPPWEWQISGSLATKTLVFP